MLDNHGWAVEIFEARSDPRLEQSMTPARSINLALSARGIEAIRAIDPHMVERILEKVTPMKGRMIHSIDGKLSSQPYGLYQE
ncbi:hypothetical protein O181_090683, partial [Austropuccinia psidii MF-1]|nr:hypothetical protein [Austropuccinia psidii MF-1]